MDLIELPFDEYDLILGMDWLVKYQVSLDCVSQRVTLRTDENNKVLMVGKHRDYLSNTISAMVADKLVQKGCEKLLGIPSDKNVKFDINLLSGVSIAPYHMAPKELAKLKAELQKLLDRGFIQPSVSPWGHQYYLLRKRMDR
ncbi:uncharacterized protein LOC128041772 [Gossypium raimondii]|uniref:uncharacterized protein LOC128041772 n=1 Tax=Gossypium raimondii TaxID=29730 RepID=UPI00227CB3F5|nr:uncharacterized protein LOC128041772 [Gossypium raimondii]